MGQEGIYIFIIMTNNEERHNIYTVPSMPILKSLMSEKDLTYSCAIVSNNHENITLSLKCVCLSGTTGSFLPFFYTGGKGTQK